MIDNLRSENFKEHKEVTSRIDTVEEKIEEIAKFRWMAAGVLAVIILIAPIVTNHITNLTHNSQIHKILK
jgi:hypothetical protein